MIKEIRPVSEVDGAVYVPGSKSITHRLLFISSLALGTSTIRDVLYSDDTIYTMEALKKLGIQMWEEEKGVIHVKGVNGRLDPPKERTEIYVGNSGTTARFLCAFSALAKKEVLITGDERLKQRPMEDLLKTLMEAAVEVKFLEKEWHLPVIIKGPMIGGLFLMPKAPSSQYVSSLLIVGPCLRYGMELAIKEPPYSKPYILLTLEMMKRFGINYGASEDLRLFRIPPQPYRAKDITVEGDASSACYFWAAAAATAGKMSVVNVYPNSKQPDIKFLDILKRMGCYWEKDTIGLTVRGPAELIPVKVDMNDMPDQVPTLAILALFAKGETVIRNIGHLRGKETDRIKAIVNEIRKIGGKIKEIENGSGILIEGDGGKNLHGAEIETYNDHRIAMSFAIAGLRIGGIRIKGADCVKKSFPEFWDIWERVCYGKA